MAKKAHYDEVGRIYKRRPNPGPDFGDILAWGIGILILITFIAQCSGG